MSGVPVSVGLSASCCDCTNSSGKLLPPRSAKAWSAGHLPLRLLRRTRQFLSRDEFIPFLHIPLQQLRKIVIGDADLYRYRHRLLVVVQLPDQLPAADVRDGGRPWNAIASVKILEFLARQ